MVDIVIPAGEACLAPTTETHETVGAGHAQPVIGSIAFVPTIRYKPHKKSGALLPGAPQLGEQ